ELKPARDGYHRLSVQWKRYSALPLDSATQLGERDDLAPLVKPETYRSSEKKAGQCDWRTKVSKAVIFHGICDVSAQKIAILSRSLANRSIANCKSQIGLRRAQSSRNRKSPIFLRAPFAWRVRSR